MRHSAYWCMSSNFGDVLTPWMMERLTGEPPIWVNHDVTFSHDVWVGSILNWANEHAVVWGAGLGSITDQVNPKAKILAVRGPLSAFRARMCGAEVPEVYGDPALCLPYFLPKPKPNNVVAIVPHYVDYYRVWSVYKDKPEYRIVNPLRPVEEAVFAISSARAVVSSSLHGLIVADAYKIPCAWAQFSDSIGGDGMKYVDHLQAVGKLKVGEWARPVDCREEVFKGEDFWEKHYKVATYDPAALWAACPIKSPDYVGLK